jgi:Tol biopolymer transport system component
MIHSAGNMKILKLQFLMLFLFSGIISAQTADELKTLFVEAESHYLYEEYELANPLYLMLNDYEPGNANIKYKIGNCYLYIPNEKTKAIPFLEEAVKNASYESKTESIKEKRAPLDAYFSLANAYRINNELEKALNTYQTFNRLVGEKGSMVNSEFVNQQIQACKNAITFSEKPVAIDKTNIGTEINQGSINDDPAISFDGKTLVYTEKRGIVSVIYYTIKERDKWQTPIDITSQLNAGEDCTSCSLNSDGTELYLYKNDIYDGNIFVSNLVKGVWTPIKKLNKNINTKFYESHASVSADGKKLYFTSNRDGGLGGLDIYVSEKDASGQWGPATNLGPTINTEYNEDTPFITQDGLYLYFSSEGHSNMGGYDVFRSMNLKNSWKSPENLGSPINSTDDDIFYQPANNGKNAYYSILTGYKKKEIFYMSYGETLQTQKSYEIKGSLKLSDKPNTKFDKNFVIRVINKPIGDTIDSSFPDELTGSYSVVVPAGKYEITFSGPGYISQTIDTTILSDNPVLSLFIDVTLEPEVYEKMDLSFIPTVAAIDSSVLITNMTVRDVTDKDSEDKGILYFTIQVIALHNPVDVSYFKNITNMKVLYSDTDKFYRYTTGQYKTREEADAARLLIIKKGYPEEIFIKKVSKE